MLKKVILGVTVLFFIVAFYYLSADIKGDSAELTVQKSLPNSDQASASVNAARQTTETKKETQTPPSTKTSLSSSFLHQRQQLLAQLDEIEDCENNGLCPFNEQDPKQSLFQQETMLVNALKNLQKMHQKEEQYDETLAEVTGKYLSSPLGRVQYQAINMMAQQPNNQNNANILLSALSDSYDSKVMASAMEVLAEYPEQQQHYENMLIQTLTTGSFYVSRTVAKEVRHILTTDNIAKFEDLAQALPANTAKAKILKASIADFKASQ
ncbi:hypothetical protein [Thalassotalea profundi]|uniref:HEAT repeat domain-containing protein n=1 Tax=Thalassotalea profundi TaxID=2036687 RepID=A0ABQ3IB34_9GAMM|nr:hypothetical protein [Thalassotalea profundi]GHE77531.1 hypothetical protein GCM10011501_01400 [Thalassotalea profundi]